MKTFDIKLVREGRCWYVDEKNGFSKAQNQLVLGVPQIIERSLGDQADVESARFLIAQRPEDADPEMVMVYLSKKMGENSGTEAYVPAYQLLGWLCPVFEHYFPNRPSKLWFKVVPA